MAEVFSFPASTPSFDNAAPAWLLKADSDEAASITIPVGPFYAGNQLDYRVFVEIFDGNDIDVCAGSLVIGAADSHGDTNGSNTATANGNEITIVCEGPCRHVISKFTFDVAPG